MNSESLTVSTHVGTINTPLADKLAGLRRVAGRSFHALPLSGGASIAHSAWNAKFEELFGQDFLRSDLTITGKHFDSLFFSEGIIREAEELAAQLYGADQTLFVTTGTTTSNQIAVTALCSPNGRALMDKNCHQSIHFSLNGLGARVDHLPPTLNCYDSGRSVLDLDNMLSKILCAQAIGDSYELIVLTAHSYEGIVYNVPAILEFLLANGVTTRRFVIDEAWGAANYFHEKLRPYGAMSTTHLASLYPDLAIAATQSAHKSLSCFRQASMIHFRGPASLAEKLRVTRFRLHTTSPSYPILASLDLARGQMQSSGLVMMQGAVTLAKQFEDAIITDPKLSSYRINRFDLPNQPFIYANVAPMQVSLNVSELVASPLDIRDRLFEQYDIYINRLTQTSLLLNFHIGIDQNLVDELLAALRDLQRKLVPDWSLKTQAESFIVPYPPGVPLILPGEEVTPQLRHQLQDIARSGTRVFTI